MFGMTPEEFAKLDKESMKELLKSEEVQAAARKDLLRVMHSQQEHEQKTAMLRDAFICTQSGWVMLTDITDLVKKHCEDGWDELWVRLTETQKAAVITCATSMLSGWFLESYGEHLQEITQMGK